MSILQILQHPLEEGQWFVKHHRHCDLGQLLADAVLQDRPEGKVAAAELGHWECSPGDKKIEMFVLLEIV